MNSPESARFRVRRDDRPDLSFVGVKLADVSYTDGITDRLYRTGKGQYVYSTKVEAENEITYDGIVFNTIDDLIKHFETTYGSYSYRMKNMLADAAKVDASLRRYFVEEI